MGRAVRAAPASLGVGSVLLLAAAVRWAHHWGTPRTDALVASWAAVTVGALALGVRARARLGIALVGVSLLALVVAGVAWAVGYDPAGACGGG